ncbi:MAG: hypothetical protein WC503_06750 [Candidatus Shapirobacteria bacterium]
MGTSREAAWAGGVDFPDLGTPLKALCKPGEWPEARRRFIVEAARAAFESLDRKELRESLRQDLPEELITD